MTSRAIVWVRVSTEEQTVENQLLPLHEEAAKRELEIIDEYVLEGVSGWKSEKHERALEELVTRAQNHEYEVLLIVALDRLTRRGPVDAVNTCDALFKAGISIVSLRDSWLTNDVFREPLVAIFGWIAREESRIRSERAKASVERRREQGKPVGRITVVKKIDMDFVVEQRRNGASWRTIARLHPRTIKTSRGGWRAPSFQSIRRAYEAQFSEHP